MDKFVKRILTLPGQVELGVLAEFPFTIYRNGKALTSPEANAVMETFPGKGPDFLAAYCLFDGRRFFNKDQLLSMSVSTDKLGLPRLTFPKGGIESTTMPGYYHIPGYSAYLVSTEKPHRVFRQTGLEISKCVSGGYVNVYVRSDDLRYFQSTRLHRLILMTFDHPGSFPEPKEANHRDLNTLNYDLDNLDWLTPGENQLYSNAVKFFGQVTEGSSKEIIERYLSEKKATASKSRSIRTEGVVFRVYDVETAELVLSGSVHDVCKLTGADMSKLGGHLRSDFPGKTIVGKYRVLFPHEKFSSNERLAKASYPKKLLVKNLTTGEETVYGSTSEFIRVSGLTRKQVFGRLERKSKTPCNGFVFEYCNG